MIKFLKNLFKKKPKLGTLEKLLIDNDFILANVVIYQTFYCGKYEKGITSIEYSGDCKICYNAKNIVVFEANNGYTYHQNHKYDIDIKTLY